MHIVSILFLVIIAIMLASSILLRYRGGIQLEQELFIFIILLIGIGVFIIWYLGIPMIVRIPITIVLLYSMYLQIMVFWKNMTIPEVIMKLHDRLYNEMIYQIVRRGYIVKVKPIGNYDEDEKYKLESDVPKYKKRYIKVIAMCHVVLTPAWRFRVFEEEEDAWEE